MGLLWRLMAWMAAICFISFEWSGYLRGGHEENEGGRT
jgi:hypothetical protein